MAGESTAHCIWRHSACTVGRRCSTAATWRAGNRRYWTSCSGRASPPRPKS